MLSHSRAPGGVRSLGPAATLDRDAVISLGSRNTPKPVGKPADRAFGLRLAAARSQSIAHRVRRVADAVTGARHAATTEISVGQGSLDRPRTDMCSSWGVSTKRVVSDEWSGAVEFVN
jgi:hypothetical protein